MTSRTRIILIAVGAVVVLIQFIPVDRRNPPTGDLVPAPPEVLEVLQTSCWDCHSNQTRWPFYAWIAPVSWLVAHDVHEGRRNINFTTWTAYSEEDRGVLIREVGEMVEEGEMPPWFYVPLHPGSGLTDAERQILLDWARREGRPRR